MAVGEGDGDSEDENESDRHGVGVDPGVDDHECRVLSEVRSATVEGFVVRDVKSEVILISRSWSLAKNLPVVLTLPIEVVVEYVVPGKMVVFLTSSTAPSSKEPSSYSLELINDDRLMPVAVDRSSAAAGAARRSAVARASFSSSKVTFNFRGTLFRLVMPVLRLRAGPPKRRLIR